MPNRAVRSSPMLAVAAVAALLAACSPPNPPRREPPLPSNAQMVQSIRAAAAKDKSVINVHPLRDPGVTSLRDMAAADEQSGHYARAAQSLDQALKLSPDAPDLLQDRAEAAIYMGDYAKAEQLARRSWSLGPKLGPLCERNWQTIVELDLHARNATAAASARKQVVACHKADIPRF